MSVISYLTTVIFDDGASKTLKTELDALSIRRPLLITDKGVKAAGVFDDATQSVRNELAGVFVDTPPNPTEEACRAALRHFQSAECDGVIAVGGGSPIDLAKAVALMASHSEPLEHYALIRGGIAHIRPDVAPIIAVPTTAGTGSEVGRGALITTDNGAKLALISPHLIPKRAICDPRLTHGLPSILTAATGIDALTHCIETYLSPLVNPPAEAIALDGARRAWAWIRRAVEDGGDTAARWNMMMAALQGGLTFQKGLGAVHALSHAAGALREPVLHHGMLNGVFLPHVLEFNAPGLENKYSHLRSAFDLKPNADLAGAVRDLIQAIGLPITLGQMGFDAKHLAVTVQRAIDDHSNATTPRRPTAAEYEALLRSAL